MTWNYRICHRPSVTGGGFSIHEVYYDSEGRIKMYTERPVPPFGDIPDELYEDMCMMMDAFDKEPLNLDHIDRILRTKKHEK